MLADAPVRPPEPLVVRVVARLADAPIRRLVLLTVIEDDWLVADDTSRVSDSDEWFVEASTVVVEMTPTESRTNMEELDTKPDEPAAALNELPAVVDELTASVDEFETKLEDLSAETGMEVSEMMSAESEVPDTGLVVVVVYMLDNASGVVEVATLNVLDISLDMLEEVPVEEKVVLGYSTDV
ncbi:hypothetical protein BAUCODRAFT_144157 [Baudoinia panamericana UAMH 10762]|uniref:Uncharacterized protein n=1 Tax=Baudoinia panamericana (strain UAMH 10762) TaxID=717646 RepID=M2N8P4_BAUPA|nr:uncharacterized protein BAUCODRAFT_144157 [Baudoinia panamericana UAMH 10762]EMD00494.1 hypothetical protein BAUCODRAFT_144157 [Baudoinia panamericana UAMH 10762]